MSGAIPGQVALNNQDGGSYLTQIVSLGGWLGFDIRFDGASGTGPREIGGGGGGFWGGGGGGPPPPRGAPPPAGAGPGPATR